MSRALAGAPKGEMGAALAAAGLLAAFALISLHGMLQWSATYDEQVYVAAGFEQLGPGRFLMKRDAPPLVPQAACISGRIASAMARHGIDDGALMKMQAGGEEYHVAQDFFKAQHGGGVFLLRAARLPILLFGVALGVYVFLFGRLLFGAAGGLLALALCAFDPNIVTHSRVVSADLGLALFFFAAHYHFWRSIGSRSLIHLAATAAMAALAMLVKFTGLLVLPSFLALAALCWAAAPEGLRGPLGMDRAAYRPFLLRRAIQGALAILGVFIVLACILYRGLDGVFRYVEGSRLIYANMPDFANYLMGEFSLKPFKIYCLAATAFKTPTGTLALAALGVGAWIKVRPGWGRLEIALLPFALIHLVAAFDRANLGLRRVLFAYPFLYLFIACIPAAIKGGGEGERENFLRRARRFSPWILAALAAIESLAVHPRQLAFFNLACGGPRNGWRLLTDSNIDWGEGLPALADYLRKEGIERVVLQYFGADDAAAYGIEFRPMHESEFLRPKREVYVVSLSWLVLNTGSAMQPGLAPVDWLRLRKPTAIVGYGLYIYDLRQGAERSGGE